MLTEWTKERIDKQKRICEDVIITEETNKFSVMSSPTCSWEYILAAKDNYRDAIIEIVRLHDYIEKSILEYNVFPPERIQAIKDHLDGLETWNFLEETLNLAIQEINQCHAKIYYLEEKLDSKIKSEDIQPELPL